MIVRRTAGIEPVPKGQCPKCLSDRILGPRQVKFEGRFWCHCYRCKHEWIVGPKGDHHRKGSPSFNPKVKK